MKGRLIWVGRENRRAPETQLCDRYLERLTRFWKMDQVVVKGRQDGDEQTILEREQERILAAVQPDDFLLICDERGKMMASKDLAAFFDKRALDSGKRVTLVIGGSYGLGAAVRQRADFMLSLSPMTLPHALARVILLEQVYRAFCIRSGHPYHHEG